MRAITLELCAETLAACLVAREGGADRIELCSNLDAGGVTPSLGLLEGAIERSGLPVHVLVRPRAGNFCYSEAELRVMCADIRHARSAGAAGVVLGVLRENGAIDETRMAELVALARPMEVTFHRAFDTISADTEGLLQALEAVIKTGCDRLLTSGGQGDMLQGANALAALVAQAGNRIAVAAGGRLSARTAEEVALRTGASHFHGSMRTGLPTMPSSVDSFTATYIVEASAIREVKEALRRSAKGS